MAKKRLKKQNFWLISLLVFVTIGILFCPTITHGLTGAGGTPAGAPVSPTTPTTPTSSGGGGVLSWLGFTADNVTAVAIWLIEPIIRFLGRLLITMTHILVAIASYEDFVNATAVKTGWTVVRDVCNMFFVLILIIIAFATILHLETYQYKRLLGKLLIAAVLINFSKVICGLLIDLAQVVMMQFVTAFSAAAEGNFASAFGLNQMLAMAQTQGGGSITSGDAAEILIAYILAGIMSLIALVVVTVVCVILVLRIVALWFLIVLSPLAYILQILPMAQKHAQQWWSKFSNEVIVGPVLAFFLWLALSVTGTHTNGDLSSELKGVAVVPSNPIATPTSQSGLAGATQTAITSIANSDAILGFILASLMFVYGLTLAQQLSTLGGGLAGSAVGKIKGWAGKAAKGLVGGAALGVGARMIARPAAHLAHGAVRAATFPLTKLGRPGQAVAKALRAPTAVMAGWSSDFAEKYDKDKVKKKRATMEKMGIGEKAAMAIEGTLGAVPGIKHIPFFGSTYKAAKDISKIAISSRNKAQLGSNMAPGTNSKKTMGQEHYERMNKPEDIFNKGAGESEIAMRTMKQWDGNNAKNLMAALDEINTTAPNKDAIFEAWANKIRTFRAKETEGGFGGKNQAVDDVADHLKKLGADPDDPKRIINYKSMAGFDQEKYEKTKRLQEEAGGGTNYLVNEDYMNNRDAYYSPSQMTEIEEQARKAQTRRENWGTPGSYDKNKMEGIGSFKEGQSPLMLANLKNENTATGKLAKELGVDKFDGVNLQGADKNKMAAAMSSDYFDQLMAEYQQMCEKPDQIDAATRDQAIMAARPELKGQDLTEQQKADVWRDLAPEKRREALQKMGKEEDIVRSTELFEESLKESDRLKIVNKGKENYDQARTYIHEDEHEEVAEMSREEKKAEAERIRRENPELDQEVRERWHGLEGDELDEELVTEYRAKNRYNREFEAPEAIDEAVAKKYGVNLKEVADTHPAKMESEKLKALYNEGNLTEVMKQLGQSRDEAKDPAAKASLQGAMDKVSNLQAGGPEALEKFKKDSALKMRLEGKGKEEWGKLKQAGKGMAEIIERDLKRGAIKVNEKIKSALADTKLGQELSRKVQAGLGKAKAVGAKVGRAKTVVTEKAGEMAGKVKESRVGRAGIRAGQEIYKGGAAATKFVKSRVTEEGRKEAYKEKILSRAEAEQQYRRQRAESRVRAAGITQKMNEKEEQIQKLDKTTPAGRDKADQLIKEKNALSEQLNAERNKLAAAKKNYEQAVAAESKAQARVAKGAKPAPTPGLTPADTKELKQAPTPEERKEFGQQAGSISVEVDKEALKEAFAEASEAIKLPSFSAAGPQGLLGDQLLLTRLLKSVDHLSSVMQKQGVSFGRMGTNIERLGKMLHQLQRARTPVARQAVLQSQGLKESDLKRIMQDLLGQGMG